MDRFLEEQEGVRDRSSSPNNHYLHNSDIKRQRSSLSTTINESDTKQMESWSSSGGAVDPLADLNNTSSQPADVNSLTTSSGTPRQIEYTSHVIHEGPAEGSTSLWASRSHSNNHESRNQESSGTVMESNEPSSPENILPHLPP